MIVRIICDLKNPNEKVDIRTLLLHLETNVAYNLTKHIQAIGKLMDVSMYEDSDRMAILTVEFEYPYSALFEDDLEEDGEYGHR